MRCPFRTWIVISVHSSAGLEVITWDQPDLSAATVHRGLPPPVVLVAEHGEDVALGEAKLLGDGGLVHV